MAGAARSILSLIALLLLAGGCLLDFFIVLSGGVYGNPVNRVYFLEAATGGIGNSPTPGAAWTWNAICQFNGAAGSSGGSYSNCRGTKAAQPFAPRRNFDTTDVPAYFDTHGTFFFAISKASWALYLIALFFGVVALFSALLAPCSRIIAFLASFMSFLAMLLQAAAAACMTAWTVIARNHFRNAGIASGVGRYAYGFTWGTFVCFFLAMILFCCGGVLGKKKKNNNRSSRRNSNIEEVPMTVREPRARKPFFGRTRTAEPMVPVTGVKDDYS